MNFNFYITSMDQEKYSLMWKYFPDHLRSILQNMMESDDLTDVTLMCEDQIQFKAHKVILSACSEVFKDIIKSMLDSVIYLRGIQSTEMNSFIGVYVSWSSYSGSR